jgi:hypothetical protein
MSRPGKALILLVFLKPYSAGDKGAGKDREGEAIAIFAECDFLYEQCLMKPQPWNIRVSLQPA